MALLCWLACAGALRPHGGLTRRPSTRGAQLKMLEPSWLLAADLQESINSGVAGLNAGLQSAVGGLNFGLQTATDGLNAASEGVNAVNSATSLDTRSSTDRSARRRRLQM